jgi:hypothetical protein
LRKSERLHHPTGHATQCAELLKWHTILILSCHHCLSLESSLIPSEPSTHFFSHRYMIPPHSPSLRTWSNELDN